MLLCASVSISVGSSLRSKISVSKDTYFFVLIESAKFPPKKLLPIRFIKKWQIPNPCQSHIESIFVYNFLLFYWGDCQLLFLIYTSLVLMILYVLTYLLAICTSINFLSLSAELRSPKFIC